MTEELIEIRKYANRRLYDTSQSRYITLADVSEMVQAGQDVRVIDAKTQEDLTKSVMLQIILESKTGHEVFPLAFLRRVIQAGNQGLRQSIREYLLMGIGAHKEFNRQVSDMMQVGMRMNPLLAPWFAVRDRYKAKRRASQQAQHTASLPAKHEAKTSPKPVEAAEALPKAKEATPKTTEATPKAKRKRGRPKGSFTLSRRPAGPLKEASSQQEDTAAKESSELQELRRQLAALQERLEDIAGRQKRGPD